ncbi:hypothetical protein Tco_1402832 [Tanacetum coccineum]
MTRTRTSNQKVRGPCGSSIKRGSMIQIKVTHDISALLVKRAETNGCKALLLTTDAPKLGRREADIKNKMTLPQPKNYEDRNKDSNIEAFVSNILDPSLSWKLLEKIMEKLDALLRSLTHLDKEFSHMTELTKSDKYLESFEDGVLINSYGLKVKLACATLYYLLHSERVAICENGYVWLGDMLIAEINDDGDSIWSNIKNLQKQITLASVKDYSPDLDIPLPIWLMCGLLKSKNNLIRWGFLFVLERVLMCCKILLDKNELQHSVGNEDHEKTRLDKANVVIDIISSALLRADQRIKLQRHGFLLCICSIHPDLNGIRQEDFLGFTILRSTRRDKEDRNHHPPTHHKVSDAPHNRKNRNTKLSKEKRVAKLKEMQMDVELHEEQRWRRLKPVLLCTSGESAINAECYLEDGKLISSKLGLSIFSFRFSCALAKIEDFGLAMFQLED